MMIKNASVEDNSIRVNDILIRARDDNYVNATQMCHASKGGKRLSDWLQLVEVADFIEVLQGSDIHQPVQEVFETHVRTYKTTWVHPDLAINLSHWLGPAFALKVSRWLWQLTHDADLPHRHTSPEPATTAEPAPKEPVEEVDLETSPSPEPEEVEVIHIASTKEYMQRDLYLVARRSRRPLEEGWVVLAEFEVSNSIVLEANIHKKLAPLRSYSKDLQNPLRSRISSSRPVFQCPYDRLEAIVAVIVDHDYEQCDLAEELIRDVERGDVAGEAAAAPKPAPRSRTKKALQKNMETDEQKRQFVLECLVDYKKKVLKVPAEEMAQVMWWEFQDYLIKRLAISRAQFRAFIWRTHLEAVLKAGLVKAAVTWRR